jgi:biopolymer transport protein ExbD/biopolymer transport protein TolR
VSGPPSLAVRRSPVAVRRKMRRFSQRNSLVTLSEINITPLLDLAFVLLIIFVITTPLLEKSIDLNLPGGGKDDLRKPNKNDIRVVEVTAVGQYRLKGQVMNLPQIENDLIQAVRANPNTIVYIRADQDGPYKHVAAIIDLCERRGLAISLRTQPDRR